MTSINDYDDPDEYLDEDDDFDPDDCAQLHPGRLEGECDHCYGETVDGPFGPVYCACAIGQGADQDECVCGPPEPAAA
jgi:hypothetical protein